MKYLIIGLGNLGKAIAENLTSIGHEVIGVDKDMHRVEGLKETISGTVCLDSTDRIALNSLPLDEMDAVFITYGKNFGVSVETVALLKSLSVSQLIVRSISDTHETVLKAIGVAEIMTPEKDFASVYASQSTLGDLFRDWYKITGTHHIYKLTAPKALVGQTLESIGFEENFDIRLTGIERPEEKTNLLGIKQTVYNVIDRFNPGFEVKSGDILILFGYMESLRKLADL